MHTESAVNTAITLLTLLMCTAVMSAYAVRVARAGRAQHARLGPKPGSPLLPGWLVEAFYWAMHAPARALIRSGASPDTLTYASLVFSAASLPLIAAGHFTQAVVAIVVGALLDAMDGMVARARRIASPSGAVLDSCVDRVSDSAPFIGLAIFYRHDVVTLVIPLVAMVASSMVSYARAKSDQHKLKLPNGLMRRHERVVYVSASLLAAPLVPQLPLMGSVRYPLALVGPTLIAVIGSVAAMLLIGRMRAALAAMEPAKVEPVKVESGVRASVPGALPVENRG
jgi:CDP-diacylglycerol--glycerol-3-phosphate 3-phosphatidyltransferase